MNQKRSSYLSAASKALHADRSLEDNHGIAPAIAQSVTYFANSAEDFAHRATDPLNDTYYASHGNPTSSRIAKVLAELEGGESAMMFASGMGAITTSVLAHVKAGDHVIAQTNHYVCTTDLFSQVLPRFGVTTTHVDQRSPDAFETAIRPNTKIIMVETPVNPTMHITDLKAVADLAKSRNITTVCDNTFATPINQNPLALGIDIVCHSATKYIGGHHDLLAGCAIGTRTSLERIWEMSTTIGAISAPFNSWLALRGVRTLHMRVKQHNANAMALAKFLEQHPKVERVLFPGLPSHPQHKLASQQMSGFGGLLSFVLNEGYDAAVAFLKHTHLVQNAGSLGGIQSLAIQPAAMWGGRRAKDVIAQQGIEPGMIRVATGIEDTQDLIEDFEHALDAVG